MGRQFTYGVESLVNGIVPVDTNNYVGCINVDYLRGLSWVGAGNVAAQSQRPPLADLVLGQAKAAHGRGVQGQNLSFALASAAVLRDQVEEDLGTVDQQVLAPQFLAEEVLQA